MQYVSALTTSQCYALSKYLYKDHLHTTQ